jgi:uncharacterized MAPEG superfamily protein
VTPELLVLALAGLLQAVQYALMSVPATLELGPGRALGPRDDAADLQSRLSPRTARLYRALDNHFEALVLFTLAVVVVTLSGAASPRTAACAWTYLAARVLYVPGYLYGWNPGRSILYGIAYLATGLMAVAALL